MIGNIAHGVDGFLRGACRDQHMKAGHILFAGQFLVDVFQNDFRVREFPCARVPTGEIAGARLDDRKPIFAQDVQVVLRDGIFVHPGVHGRGNQLFALACQHGCGEHIVRQAMRHFRDHVGGCRCDQAEICGLCERDVLHLKLKIAVKGIHQAFISGQAFKSDGIDKVCGVLCHQDMDDTALLMKRAGQIGGFIGGDSSSDAQ